MRLIHYLYFDWCQLGGYFESVRTCPPKPQTVKVKETDDTKDCGTSPTSSELTSPSMVLQNKMGLKYSNTTQTIGEGSHNDWFKDKQNQTPKQSSLEMEYWLLKTGSMTDPSSVTRGWES